MKIDGRDYDLKNIANEINKNTLAASDSVLQKIFDAFDTDGDGKLSKQEITETVSIFSKLDENGDSNGELSDSEFKSGANNLQDKVKATYSELKTFAQKLFEFVQTDGMRKVVKEDGNGGKAEYYYNDSGKRMKTINISADGKMSETTFDEKGNVTQLVWKDDKGNVTYSVDFTNDSQGKVESAVLKDAKGNVEYSKKYSYNANGNKTKEASKDKNVNVEEINENTYDANDNCTKHVWKDENGNVEKIDEYYYDENGNCTKSVWKDENGNVMSSYEYFYDENGNKTKAVTKGANDNVEYNFEYSYDENGNLTNRSDYSYDAKGNLTCSGENSYDANGNRTNSRDYFYNANGNVERSYENTYDTNGNKIKTVANCNNKLMGTFKYIRDNNQVKTEVYDADGKLIRTVNYETSYIELLKHWV